MGTPIAPKIGELGETKFGVQWEGIGKLQAIALKFCTVSILRPRKMLAKLQLNSPQNGRVRAPKFGIQAQRSQLCQKFWPLVDVLLSFRNISSIQQAHAAAPTSFVMLLQNPKLWGP